MSEDKELPPGEIPQEGRELPDDLAKQIASQVVGSASQEHVVMDKVTEMAAWMAAIRSPERYNPNIPFAVVPSDMKVMCLEEHMPHPKRIRKNPEFVDVDSFCRYFSEYEGGHDSKLFHTQGSNGMAIMAILDMDIAGRNERDEEGNITKRVMPLAQWNDHLAFLRLKFHDDYAELRNNSGNWFPQNEFALFVERLIHLFVHPVGADMMELAQELRGSRNAKWKYGRRLENGQTSLQYVEAIEAETSIGGNTVNIPSEITLCCPLYDGLDPIEFKAAFSYNIDDERNVLFSYRLKTVLEERDAQKKIKDEVEGRTLQPIYNVSSFAGLIAT